MNNQPEISVKSLLRLAFDEYAKSEMDSLPRPSALKAIYPDTSAMDSKILSQIKRLPARRITPLNVIKRALLVAAIASAIFSCVMLTSANVRNAVINTIVEWTDRNLGISFEIEGDPLSAIPGSYGLHYIPDGFKLDESSSSRFDDGSFFYTYNEPGGTRVLDVEAKILQNSSMTWADNEHTDFQMITFNDTDAYIGHWTSVDGYDGYTMIWTKDGIENYIYGSISLSDLFKIAENIY